MRRVVCAAVVGFLYCACTFGSLASYTVTLCNAGGTPDEQYADAGGTIPDPCNVLNQANPTSCMPWQCDVSTATCVQKTRDDDRDGDPPIACGGGDCDDTDPELNSQKVYPSTAVGTFPGQTTPTPTLSYDGVTSVIASANSGGACLVVEELESPTAMPAGMTGCTENVTDNTDAGAASSEPAQVYGVVANGVVASAFVSNYNCKGGALGFAYLQSAPEYDTLEKCPDTGTALPALALLPESTAAIAFYQTPPLSDPLQDCQSAVAAPLSVTTLTRLGSPVQNFQGNDGGTPTMTSVSTTTPSPSATSVRPPAILFQSSVLFVASPDKNDTASVWAFDKIGAGASSEFALPSLPGARGVSMGARTVSSGTQIAVVAELGCRPQSIHLTVVNYTSGTDAGMDAGTFSRVGDVELAAQGGAGFQTAPTVAWSAVRNHWLVTWVASGPTAMARFVDQNVKAMEPAFAVPGANVAAQALANGHAALVSPSNGVSDSKLRCP